MKKNYYQLYEKINDGVYLHYNSFNNSFLLLNSNMHNIYENTPLEDIENQSPKLYASLIDNQFITPDDFDEFSIVNFRKLSSRFDRSYYHVLINTTLDCNLDCWYCYENKVKGSRLKEDVINAIISHIQQTYIDAPFSSLKLSFFGGEPFMYFKGIKKLLVWAKEFCSTNSIHLLADFTTNASLIKDYHIDFLKAYNCCFQITLDGDRDRHNQIKKAKGILFDTYQTTIENIHRLIAIIPNIHIYIRINFDSQTLSKFDSILKDIVDLDKTKCSIILKKIWQVTLEDIDKESLLNVIQKLFDAHFYVDYYMLPKAGVCFAERLNQVLFNYDGGVFKCSTISTFDEKNSLGKLDINTGYVKWNENKIASLIKDITPQRCKECRLFPVCYGPCNKNLLTRKDPICTFDDINLSRKEYLLYLFTLNNKYYGK